MGFFKKSIILDIEDSTKPRNLVETIKAVEKYCEENNQTCKFISDNEVEIDGVLYEFAEPERIVIRGNYFVKIKKSNIKYQTKRSGYIQNDVVPLPKSSSIEKMKQNMDIDFELEKEDFEKIVNMEEMGWSGLDPDKF